ncbi:MAG: MarR family transcriptional regulator [Mycetocola sp.]
MSPAPNPLDLLLEIGELFRDDMARAFDGTGLTVSRTHLLWVLAGTGPSTQQALARAMEVSARNITGLVDALEGSGYVKRSPHPSDRRATIVSLTDVGEKTMKTMARDHAQLSQDLMDAVDPADRAGLTRGLDAIATRLRTLIAADTAAGPDTATGEDAS